jgi:hypothetical protein
MNNGDIEKAVGDTLLKLQPQMFGMDEGRRT